MSRKNKKKKGSTMIVLLGMSMVMVMLSAVLASALMFTTQNNEREKIDDDLLYAAEGGLEAGIIDYNEDETLRNNLQALPIGAELTFKTFNNFSKTVDEVIVKGVKKSDSEIKIASTAKVGVNSRTVVKSINKRPARSNIYEYALTSKKMDMTFEGVAVTPSFVDTRVAYEESYKIELWKYLRFDSPLNRHVYEQIPVGLPTNHEKVTFNIGHDIDESKIGFAPSIDIELKGSSGGTDLGKKLDEKVSGSNSPVQKVPYRLNGTDFSIYIINTNNLNIYYQKEVPTTTIDSVIEINNAIVVCTGDINLLDVKDKETIYKDKDALYGSTEYSKLKMKLFKASMISRNYTAYSIEFHCTYPAMIKDAHGILQTDADARIIDEIIKRYIRDWNSNAESTTETEWVVDSEVSYD